jgi:hypothetical protein
LEFTHRRNASLISQTYLQSLAGGALIGLASALYLLLDGRVAGPRAPFAAVDRRGCHFSHRGDYHCRLDERIGGSMTASARILAALVAGAIFGFGLSLSGMLDPARVRGFLDIEGEFDPSLAFVLAGAVAVSSFGYLISRRLQRPAHDCTFHLPTRKDVDLRLVTGAAILGVGWGISGLCPGPAIASLARSFQPLSLPRCVARHRHF